MTALPPRCTIVILNSNGKLFIIETKFHVLKKAFEDMINNTKGNGFEIIEKPKVSLSRAIIFKLHTYLPFSTNYFGLLYHHEI